jgi:glycerate-2-kinase
MKDLREAAKRIFLRTLELLDLERIIKERIEVVDGTLIIGGEQIPLSDHKEIVLIGFGKASIRMGAAVEAILKEHIIRGILVTNRRSSIKVKSRVVVAGHPIPNANSFNAGKEILEMVRSCEKDSLIMFLISGGGSSLVELPFSDEVKLEEIKDLNRILINCGATIGEINVLRKHLSLIKGGRLGFQARGCRSIALYVSDVNEDDLRSIASNPLLPDEASLEEFFRIIEKYNLLTALPYSIYRAVSEGRIPEVPKAWDREGQVAFPLLLLQNSDALEIAAKVAKERGFEVEIDYSQAEGDYRSVSENQIRLMSNLRNTRPNKSICLISGGEVSCPVQGQGSGGRNQEYVLYSASQLAISGIDEAAVFSCGTDGVDGNSFATGAVADPETIRNAERLGLSVSQYLRTNDSHSFFREMGGMVVSGPTENNVRDIRIMLAR